MKTYSLNSHDVNLFGIDIVEDVGKITTKPVGVVNTARRGVDATTTVSQNLGNENRSFELELGYGSKTHALLSAAYQIAKAAGQVLSGPMVIKDRQGTSIEMTIEAFLEGMPEAERAPEAGVLVWKGEMCNPTVFFGGLPG